MKLDISPEMRKILSQYFLVFFILWFPLSLYMIYMARHRGILYGKEIERKAAVEAIKSVSDKLKEAGLVEDKELSTKPKDHPDSTYYDPKKFNYFRLEVEFDYEGYHGEMEIRSKARQLLDYLVEAPELRRARQISLKGVCVQTAGSRFCFDVDVVELDGQKYFQKSYSKEKE